MTLRSFAASAALIAVGLTGVALHAASGETTRAQDAPFTVAATQTTAPDFVGLGN